MAEGREQREQRVFWYPVCGFPISDNHWMLDTRYCANQIPRTRYGVRIIIISQITAVATEALDVGCGGGLVWT